MKDIKSNEQLLFSIRHPQGVKLLSWLRLNFSHLQENKFRHSFKECGSPMCGCRLEIESNKNIFLHFHFYHVERSNLLNGIYDINLGINELNKDSITNLIWFGSDKIIKRQTENYVLAVWLISKLVKDLMKQFYSHRQ